MKTLITSADVKALTVVGLTADDHKLNLSVPDAQLVHLRPLLGAALLAQLLAFVADAPEPPAPGSASAQVAAAAQAAYATALDAWRTARAGNALLPLWEAVKSCLAQWTLVEAWPHLPLHINAAGFNEKTGSGTGTSMADVATRNQALTAHRQTAVLRGEELVSWLETHKTDYLAYVSSRPAATGQQPIDYFGGISL